MEVKRTLVKVRICMEGCMEHLECVKLGGISRRIKVFDPQSSIFTTDVFLERLGRLGGGCLCL